MVFRYTWNLPPTTLDYTRHGVRPTIGYKTKSLPIPI
nr:MAG TPA: hypothetical protein [Caudoviricetes sp.]DAU40689.1 MAG TPA: hypothetical protein [Caudoviricetes sp.]